MKKKKVRFTVNSHINGEVITEDFEFKFLEGKDEDQIFAQISEAYVDWVDDKKAGGWQFIDE